jgi:hypothetical protein
MSDTLSKAKSVLAGAEKAFPSSMAPKSSVDAAKNRVKPITVAPKISAPASGVSVNSRAGNIAANRDILSPGDMSLPKLHNGGPVPADGAYQLKAGEHVLTEEEAKTARKHALRSAGLRSLARVAKPVAKDELTTEKKTLKGVSAGIRKADDNDAPIKLKK